MKSASRRWAAFSFAMWPCSSILISKSSVSPTAPFLEDTVSPPLARHKSWHRHTREHRGYWGGYQGWRVLVPKPRGQSVILLERGDVSVASSIQSRKVSILFDVGPQSFLSTPLLSRIIDDLGLSAELLKADPKAPRYILLGGKLLRAPTGPLELLRTPLISTSTKLRLFAEVFRHTRPPSDDETVAAFVRRKFGSDLLTNVVAPFVSGVYAGDPERLSLVSAFAAVRRLEERHGSIIRGAIRSRRRSGGKRPSLCNFKIGMRALTDGLQPSCANTQYAMPRSSKFARTKTRRTPLRTVSR